MNCENFGARRGRKLKTTAIIGELREHRAIVARLKAAIQQSDFSMVVLFPTLSLLREIETELLDQPDLQGIGGVRLLLFEGFIGEITERLGLQWRKPSELQRELLITEAFRILKQSGRLSYLERVPLTANYRRALLDGIAEWKRAGLTPDLLVRWAVDQGEKEQQLALVYFTYQHLLTERGLLEEDGLLEQLRKLRAQTGPVGRRAAVLLYGFTDLTPQQADLLDVLTLWFDFEALIDPTAAPDLQPLIRRYFNFKSAVSEGSDEGVAALARLRQSFWRGRAVGIEMAGDDHSLQLLTADGWSRQALALAREIRALLRSDAGYELADFLIISPQPQQFLQAAAAVFAEYQLPLPQPSRATPEFPSVVQYRQALRAVAEGWQWSDLEGLIRQFYAGTDPKSWDKLLLSLGKGYGALSGKERWLELLANPRWVARLEDQGILAEPLRQCLDFLMTIPTAASWRTYLQLTHDWFQNSGVRTLAGLAAEPEILRRQLLNYEAGEQLRQACAELLQNLDFWADLAGATSPSLGEFLRFFDDYLLAGEVAPVETFSARLRVIPPREARGLRAKVVFITGLEQGMLPRTYINDWKLSSVSRFELKTLGVELETGEQYQKQERLAFYWALQTAAERLYLVAREQDDSGQPLNYSPFLAELLQLVPALVSRRRYYPLEPQAQRDFNLCYAPEETRRLWVDCLMKAPDSLAGSLRQACDYWLQTSRYHQLALKIADWRDRSRLAPQRPFSTNPQVLTMIMEEFGAEHCFSVTALEEYRNCPYSFFLKRFLRIQPVVTPGLLPELLDLGNLYHQIFREFGERYRGQVFQSELREEYWLTLETSLCHQLQKWRQAATNALVAAALTIQEQQIRRTLQRWLTAELQWAAQTGGKYRPYLLEYSFGLPPGMGDPDSTPQAFVLDSAQGQIRLNGRIDRIDREADGRLIIYDYKLGRSQTTSGVLEFKNIQIPVYLKALEQLLGGAAQPVGGCYLSLKEPSRTSAGVWRQAKIGLSGRSKGLLGEPEWREWLEQIDRVVLETVQAIRSGFFYLTEEQCPAYCDYRVVCRRGEREEEEVNGLSAQ
jgi:ATP-dependent helicase/DNAse subunit B